MSRLLLSLPLPLVTLLAITGCLLLVDRTASAGSLSLSVTCPRSVPTGGTVTLDVRVENRMCEAMTGRVITSLVGNAADIDSGPHAGAIGVLPPKVATDELQIGAAIDAQPAVCAANGRCTGTTASFCTTDADCRCRPFLTTPSVTALQVPTADPFPAVFEGVQVLQVVVVDVPGTSFSDEETCTIPEADTAASGIVGLAAMITLRANQRRRRTRKRAAQEYWETC